VETIELSHAGQARESATWVDSSSRHCLNNFSFKVFPNERTRPKSSCFQQPLDRQVENNSCQLSVFADSFQLENKHHQIKILEEWQKK